MLKRLLRNRKGFTLIEMLIVLFIVGLLMLLMIPNLASQQEKAQKRADEAIIEVIQTQKEVYKLDHDTLVDPSVEALLSEGYITQKQKDAYEKAKP